MPGTAAHGDRAGGSSIDMPIMLVILGVFGGFISLGFLGLFIGPALLAVAFSLLVAWQNS